MVSLAHLPEGAPGPAGSVLPVEFELDVAAPRRAADGG